MARLSAFVPRLVALTLIWLLATAALTYAAGKRMAASVVKPLAKPPVQAQRRVLVVPDVRRQAYVFAKGILGDAGFAWKVEGGVQGYAANLVATQVPQPGTRVIDTGAPTMVLHLQRSGRETGAPESGSSFPGTPLRLADLSSNVVKIPRTPLAAPKPAAKPKKLEPAAKTKPAAKPQPAAKAKPAAKHKAAWPQQRPPAFVAPGAKPEPLNEMPLPNRAQALLAWVDQKPPATDANVQHWLYQHEWVLTGAQLGWWRGAEALRTLIAADRRVWNLWGIGARSESLARRTLAEVQARSK